jgi:hypothetical protein
VYFHGWKLGKKYNLVLEPPPLVAVFGCQELGPAMGAKAGQCLTSGWLLAEGSGGITASAATFLALPARKPPAANLRRFTVAVAAA